MNSIMSQCLSGQSHNLTYLWNIYFEVKISFFCNICFNNWKYKTMSNHKLILCVFWDLNTTKTNCKNTLDVIGMLVKRSRAISVDGNGPLKNGEVPNNQFFFQKFKLHFNWPIMTLRSEWNGSLVIQVLSAQRIAPLNL